MLVINAGTLSISPPIRSKGPIKRCRAQETEPYVIAAEPLARTIVLESYLGQVIISK